MIARILRQSAARMLKQAFAAAVFASPLALPAIADAQIKSATESKPVVAVRPSETEARLTPKQVTEIGTRGACWIMHWHDGLKYSSHGSGWVLDVEKRLIVTNEHVVTGRDTVEIFFPNWNGDKVNRDYQEYLLKGKSVRATVIDRDRNRDLALLQVDEIPAGMKALKLADQPAEEGDLVRTVGGLPRGNEALWGTVSGEVRLVAKRQNSNGGYGMMVVTSMPTNGGNSGGAIVNERGEVVAVVEGGYSGTGGDGQITLNVTLHVDLSELKSYLAETVPLAEPKDANAFATRGLRRLNAGSVDQAAGDFSEAVKRDRKNVNALIGRGKTFARKGDNATALADFDDAIKLDDQSFDAHIARGRARAALGKIDDAVADLTKAIRIDPNSTHGYNERGNVHHNSGKNFPAAIEDYTRAINLMPNDPVLWSNRANSNERSGKIAEAIADRKKVTELQPNADWRWAELGRLYLWNAKQYRDAYNAFIKANELNPREAIHLADIGDALLEDGQFGKAVSAFSDSLELNRKHATLNVAYTTFRRGLARKGAKDLAGAVEDFSQAIRVDPKYARAYHERGLVLKANGKDEEAKADLDQAAKLDPKLAKAVDTAVEVPVVQVASDIVGTWVFDGTIKGVPTYERATFMADGSVTSKIRARGRDGIWREIEDSGTYKVTGNRLSLSLKILGYLERKIERTGDSARVSELDGSWTATYTLLK